MDGSVVAKLVSLWPQSGCMVLTALFEIASGVNIYYFVFAMLSAIWTGTGGGCVARIEC